LQDAQGQDKFELEMLHNPFRHVSNQDAGESADDCAAFQRFKQWVERRLSLRRDVNISVLVLQGTQVQSGILVDLSDGGFGLSKVDRIAPDELISVATPDGRILEGRVVWAKDSRAGVALMSRS
jgi:hypothetical protein